MPSTVKRAEENDLFLVSGADVGEDPRGFVLQLGAGVVGKELREARHDSGLYHEIDRRVLV